MNRSVGCEKVEVFCFSYGSVHLELGSCSMVGGYRITVQIPAYAYAGNRDYRELRGLDCSVREAQDV